MNVEAIELTTEGFIAARALKFENGLILTSPKVLWLGKEGKALAEKQFNEMWEAIKTQKLTAKDSPCDGSSS